MPFVEEFINQLTRDDVSIKRWFSYRRPEDCETEEDKAYVTNVLKKVKTILPIIRDKSITEIENYGKAEPTEKKDAGGDILKESIPDELKGVIGEENTPKAENTSSDDDLIEQALQNN
jgi:hypothetical protein